MLPAPRTPAQPYPAARLWQALGRRLLALALPLLLVLPLGACASGGQPPRSVLLQALALQIQLTQGAIAQALELEAAGAPEVSRVRVAEQQAIRIGEAQGWRLAGAFDWRLPGDPIRVDSPFELFLQRGARGESWRLARPSGSPDGSTQAWITDPLPIPG
ncbi:MAG: hypothetical protein ACKO50_07310 [Cyanobium sp.]